MRTEVLKKLAKLKDKQILNKFTFLLNPKMYRQLNRLPIRKRLMLSFLLVSVVPLFLMGFISYQISRNAIMNKVTKYSTRELTQTVNNIALVLKPYEDFSIQVMANNDVSGAMKKFSEPMTNLEHFKAMQLLQTYFQSAFPIDIGYSIAFFPAAGDEVIFAGDSNNFQDFKKTGFFKNAVKKGGSFWDYQGNNMVHLRTLKSVVGGVSLGTLGIFLSPAKLDQAINSALYNDPDFAPEKITEFPYAIVLNQAGKIVATPFTEDLGKNIAAIVRNQQFMRQLGADKEMRFNERIKNKDVFVTCEWIEKKGWYLLDIAPNSFLYRETGMLGWTALLIGLVISAVAVVISFGVAVGISNPLQQVMQAMKQAAGGDLSVKVSLPAEDELGQLGNSFNGMIGEIRGLMNDTQKAVAAVLNHSKSLDESSAQSAHTSEAVAAATEEITRGTMEQTQEAEKASQKMVNLAKQIEVVTAKSGEVEAITESARGMSQQSIQVIQQLIQKANETDVVTNTVIQEIRALSASAGEIQNLTDVIANIAEQTNLLALNATIEAARAGEMGLGFAVVAEEVNKLAFQSQTAATTIQKTLKEIQARTEASTQTASRAHQIVAEQLGTVQKAQQTFTEITRAMDHIAQRIADVNENIKMINTVKEDTVSSIMNISAISQEAAASSEEVSASTEEQTAIAEQVSMLAHELSSMAEQLVGSIEKFKADIGG